MKILYSLQCRPLTLGAETQAEFGRISGVETP